MTMFAQITHGVLLLRPHQSVDHRSSREIAERLAVAINEDVHQVVIDLSEAKYSTGALLRVLIDLVNSPDGLARHIAVVGASLQFQALLTACGADAVLKQYDSVEEARNALAQQGHENGDAPFGVNPGRLSMTGNVPDDEEEFDQEDREDN